MKIYFTAAINSLDKYRKNYEAIVDNLTKMGHEVISDQILKADLEKILNKDTKSNKEYYRWMVDKIKKVDLVVAESSYPSTVNIGHEITLAYENEKPVLILYQREKNPALLLGLESEKILVEEYDLDNLARVLKDSVEYLLSQTDVRFNFFVSPKIVRYLDWISKNKKMPRAVYLRRLIEKDMERNKEFEG